MSSKPTLYGTYASPTVRAVALTLRALNVDYEFRPVLPARGEHLLASYQRKNPARTIPTLEDGGHYIGDSHAIMAFLVGKYGRDDRLYPRELYQRAAVDQRLHHENSVFMCHVKPLFNLIFSRGITTIPIELLLALEDVYAVLECYFGENSEWIAGGAHMTIADFSFVTTAASLHALRPIDVAKYPKLLDWLQRMEALPYYSSVMQHEAVSAVENFIRKGIHFVSKL